MKTLKQRIYTSPKYPRLLQWGKLITITGSAQVVVQGIGFICGIIIIRLLPTHEYALYILANTMLANMCILSDGGIKTSVMSQGGQVWQNRNALGEVLVTGLHLRKRFAVGSIIITLPILLYLLQHHGASWLMSIFIVLSLVPVILASMSGSLYEIVPKLHQVVIPLQKISIKVSLVRLTFLLIALFSFPLAFVAIVAAGIPQFWANIKLKYLCLSFADIKQKVNPSISKKILQMVKRILPESIYSCLAGPITIWLLSIFGSTTSVAQLGALTRLAMLMTLFDVLFGTLISPRFSRLPEIPKLLLKRYIQIQLSLFLVTILVICSVNIFSTKLLWILGPNYADLAKEVTLMIIGCCIGFIAISNFYLCTSKGWVINPLLTITVSLISILSGIYFFDVSSLSGVLLFSIFTNTIMLVLHSAYGITKIKFLNAKYNKRNRLMINS